MRNTASTQDPKAVGSAVRCVVCDQRKKPVGRSAPLASHFCDHGCPGYPYRPLPGSLWPSETREAFGYPCSTAKELDGVGPVYNPREQLDPMTDFYGHPLRDAALEQFEDDTFEPD